MLGYVKKTFDLSVENTIVIMKSAIPVLNSMNHMMGWGLQPTIRDPKSREFVGSFQYQKQGVFVEGLKNIVVSMKIDYKSDWYTMLTSLKPCVFDQMMQFSDNGTCSPLVLPDKYVLVITREVCWL